MQRVTYGSSSGGAQVGVQAQPPCRQTQLLAKHDWQLCAPHEVAQPSGFALAQLVSWQRATAHPVPEQPATA